MTHFGQNVGLGEELVGSYPETYKYMIHWFNMKQNYWRGKKNTLANVVSLYCKNNKYTFWAYLIQSSFGGSLMNVHWFRSSHSNN